MAEEKLNLLQFASRGPAEASARPTQVVWREPVVANVCGEFLHHVPNQFLGHSVAPRSAHLSEEVCTGSRTDHVRSASEPSRRWGTAQAGLQRLTIRKVAWARS
jgi:hypothetical protein